MFDRIQPDVHARQKRPVHLLLASALLAVAVLALLAACDLPGSAATPTDAPVFSPIVQHSPVVSSGQVIEQAITQFCGAVHAGSYDQAYTYLSSAYKTTVTSASQVPNVLGQGRKLTNCADFGNGEFLKISGMQATDQLMLTYLLVQLGSSAQGGGSMSFVQVGSAWQIDGITG